MFDAIAPRYDLVNRLISLGLDASWRRRTVGALELAPPSRLVDLGCGTGDLAAEARRAGHRVVGVDLSYEMLRVSRRSLLLVQADATKLPLGDGTVDGVISGFALRNVADLAAFLAEAARVVRPGGRVALLEVDEPDSPLLRAGHRLWFRHVVPRIGAMLSDPAAYRYLPRSVAYLPAKEEVCGAVRRRRLRRLRARASLGRVGPDPLRHPVRWGSTS